MTRKIAPKLKKAKKVRKLTTHHLNPRSRGGSNHHKNLVMWDENFHRAYHTLFENLRLAEAIQLLLIVSQGGDEWTLNDIHLMREMLKHETERHEQRTVGDGSDNSHSL